MTMTSARRRCRRSRFLRRGQVVGMGGRRLNAVQLGHERIEGRNAFARRERALILGGRAEGQRADGVPCLSAT